MRFQREIPTDITHALQKIEGILHVIKKARTQTEIESSKSQLVDHPHIGFAKLGILTSEGLCGLPRFIEKTIANFDPENPRCAAVEKVKTVISLLGPKIDGGKPADVNE